MSALYALLIFLALALIGFPIAISLGFASLAFAMMMNIPFSIISQTLFTSLDSYSYIAIPMFILVGNLMDSGGLSKRLVGFATSLCKKIPGSLGSILVASCAFFGAISGSASATTASIGGMLVPSMIDKKYPRGYAGALAAVSGTLGAMIPPSIVMIIYAVAAEVSVSDMFIAGFLPGILFAVVLIISNTVFTKIKKIDVVDPNVKFSWKEVGISLWNAKWALLTPVIILGGIYSGIFTATECSVIAAVYSLIIGVFVYKELKFKDLLRIFGKTFRTVGSVLIVIPFAIAFGKLLTISQTPAVIGSFVLSLTNNPNLILLMVVVLVFIFGMFMDSAPIILIITPLFLPILKSMGVSPIHFGIIMTMGSMIAAVTPPVGVNLFIGQGIANTGFVDIMKYAIPLILVQLAYYVFIALNPWISTSVLALFS